MPSSVDVEGVVSERSTESFSPPSSHHHRTPTAVLAWRGNVSLSTHLEEKLNLLTIHGLYVSLVAIVLKTLRPPIPNNALTQISRDWRSPKDSLALITPFPAHFSDDLQPVRCHSHNDFARRVPLYQALAAGCISVEADVYLPSSQQIKKLGLKDDDLLVGHKRSSLKGDRTLRSLYSEPLLRILEGMNEGNNVTESGGYSGIFAADPDKTLTLLLDFKESKPEAIENLWRSVQTNLDVFRSEHGSPTEILTRFDSKEGKRLIRPLTVVLTGSTPFEFVTNTTKNPARDVFFDAPLHDLSPTSSSPSPYNISNSYWASTNMANYVSTPGVLSGKFSRTQIDLIQMQIEQASDLELVSRYWGTPGWPVGKKIYVWRLLEGLGVGLLNVDDVEVAARWDWELKWWLGWCWLLRGVSEVCR